MTRYKLHDTESGASMEVNKMLVISLIHDQYPDTFSATLDQFFETNGLAKTCSVRGGMLEKI